MTTRFRYSAPAVDILVQSERWAEHPGLDEWILNCLHLAAEMTPNVAWERAEVAVVLSDDEQVRLLNRTWRNRDAATNVLSFPAQQAGMNADPSAPRTLGDIVLAYETLAREAEQEGVPFEAHLAHLLVHGLLHLVGFDHEAEEQASVMEEQERRILARLGVPDPYAAPSSAAC